MNGKKRSIFISVILALLLAMFSGNIIGAGAEGYVYLGGMPAGFKLDNVGATIIGVNEVISTDGLYSPAKDAGFSAGDVLISLDGRAVNSAADIEKILSDYDGNGISAVVERNGEILIRIVYPAKDIAGKFRLGAFIRDDISGIGTITYIKEDLSFGALGHPVVDSTQKIIRINAGKAFRCNIIGVNKGERGKAGEIRGYFMEDEPIGEIAKNVSEGIFGKITDKEFKDGLKKVETAEAKPGKASIYTTVEGTTPREYEISIVKYDKSAAENKNIVIKVTDERLLNKTAGILQGMSGSPIIQGGKLVGAVTHVFINDPARGFGISIEKMLKE